MTKLDQWEKNFFIQQIKLIWSTYYRHLNSNQLQESKCGTDYSYLPVNIFVLPISGYVSFADCKSSVKYFLSRRVLLTDLKLLEVPIFDFTQKSELLSSIRLFISEIFMSFNYSTSNNSYQDDSFDVGPELVCQLMSSLLILRDNTILL